MNIVEQLQDFIDERDMLQEIGLSQLSQGVAKTASKIDLTKKIEKAKKGMIDLRKKAKSKIDLTKDKMPTGQGPRPTQTLSQWLSQNKSVFQNPR